MATRTLSPAAQLKANREAAVKAQAGDPTPSPIVPSRSDKGLTDDQKFIVGHRHPKSGLGTKFDLIAKQLHITTGKCHLLYMQAQYPEAIRIPLTEANVWRLRLGENISWGEISAMTGCPESRVRKVYGAGPSGDRARGCNLGRGGRKPADFDPRLANTATARAIKAASKKV